MVSRAIVTDCESNSNILAAFWGSTLAGGSLVALKRLQNAERPADRTTAMASLHEWEKQDRRP